MLDCKSKFITSKHVAHPLIEKARLALTGRLRMLFLFFLFAGILIYFIVIFVTTIQSSISDYNRMSDNQTYALSGNATFVSSSYDNEEYSNDTGEVQIDEYNEFKKSMASIKQIYSDYNEKVATYQRGLNKEPTDIIDEKMLLRDNDNYT